MCIIPSDLHEALHLEQQAGLGYNKLETSVLHCRVSLYAESSQMRASIFNGKKHIRELFFAFPAL